jgi:hypothetical protein
LECTGKSNQNLVGKSIEEVIVPDMSKVSPILPNSQPLRGKIGDRIIQYSIKAIRSHISSYFVIEVNDHDHLEDLGKRAIHPINHSDILVGCIG